LIAYYLHKEHQLIEMIIILIILRKRGRNMVLTGSSIMAAIRTHRVESMVGASAEMKD
jgi:hypothetical protein